MVTVSRRSKPGKCGVDEFAQKEDECFGSTITVEPYSGDSPTTDPMLTIRMTSSGNWSTNPPAGARAVDENTDTMIVAKPFLHLREIAWVGEIGSEDIDGNTSFSAKTGRPASPSEGGRAPTGRDRGRGRRSGRRRRRQFPWKLR